MRAPGYMADHDLGRLTIVFAQNPSEAQLFFNLLVRVFDEGGMHRYSLEDPTEDQMELIDLFIYLHEWFFWDYYNDFEGTFTVTADVEEGEENAYQIIIVNISLFEIETDMGFFDYLNYVLITNIPTQEMILFCNIP